MGGLYLGGGTNYNGYPVDTRPAGVPNSDFYLTVVASPQDASLATGKGCEADQFGRPTAGLVTFGVDNDWILDAKAAYESNATIDRMDWDGMLWTAGHPQCRSSSTPPFKPVSLPDPVFVCRGSSRGGARNGIHWLQLQPHARREAEPAGLRCCFQGKPRRLAGPLCISLYPSLRKDN